mmetsp:Transcript_44356/g.105018  ORF Transcript_44356/g.105018 Transcript_44356/m.105018 type:complete len:119 (+) Transcript_44356:41-397(+)
MSEAPSEAIRNEGSKPEPQAHLQEAQDGDNLEDGQQQTESQSAGEGASNRSNGKSESSPPQASTTSLARGALGGSAAGAFGGAALPGRNTCPMVSSSGRASPMQVVWTLKCAIMGCSC